MESLEKINEEIRRYKILTETMPAAQSELDRLYSQRDEMILKQSLPPKGETK